MKLKLKEKIEQVERIRENLEKSEASFIVNYRGLKTTEFTELRKKLRDAGSFFRVVKNSLASRSVEGTNLKELREFFCGPTGIIFVEDDPATSAKILKKFIQDHPYLVLKGGVLDGQILKEDEVKALGDLPGRNELLAKLLLTMQSPLRELLGVLSAPLRDLVLVLRAILIKEGGLSMAKTSAEALEKKNEAKGGGETSKREEIIKAIEGMNVLELSKLVKELEERFGVQAVSPVAVSQAPAAAEKEEKKEKTEFNVVLAEVGSKKIQVIKEVRKFVSLGLKEAKELVESAPKTIKEGASKEEALKIKEALEAVGAKVELK